MGSRWGQAQEAGYAPLPAGEEPAESPPPPPPSQSYQPAPRQHSFPHPHRQQHTALRIASDREHTVAQTLLAAAHQDAPALFAQLGTGTEGLGEEEAAARLARHGPNVIAMSGAAPWWRVLWSALAHPFNAILLLLAATSLLTKDRATASIMLAMVTLSTALRFWQEMKSTVAASKLAGQVHLKATVIRRSAQSGLPEERQTDQADVVPGDCVRLTAGEMLPGDVRIVHARDLHISQAALTGESMPASKSARAERGGRHHAHTSLLDCRCLAFRGTHVVSGTGLGIVVATGSGCYIATMAEQLRHQKPANAFQLGVQRVSYLLIGFMAAMVPLVVVSSGFMTRNWGQALLFGISVAVGLTPEMLPMVVNANLARGAVSMSKQRVLVKRLDAVQNLGAMDVLCCDTTGTLTMDEVMLARWLDYRGQASRQTLLWGFLNARFQTGLRNLLDGTILQTGREQGVGGEVDQFACVDELPFDFVRRRLSVVLQADGPPLLVCKGALAEMVPLCSSVLRGDEEVLPLDDSARDELLALGERLNEEGLRVLGVAVRELSDMETALSAAAGSTSEPSMPLAPLMPGAPKEASRHSGPSSPGVAAGTAGTAGGGWGLVASPGSGGRGFGSPTGGASGGGTPLAFAAASRRSSATSIATQRAVCLEDEQDLIFVGFLAFLDPPKETARQAVQELRDKSVELKRPTGDAVAVPRNVSCLVAITYSATVLSPPNTVELKILTGDAVAVACTVCSELGMPVRATITGAELDKLGGSDFCAAVRRATVLGKLTPGQKARVVAALKGIGHTVGFLGDGINDALALRHADVGISVDSGSDISKDAADVILLEKSLTVLTHGVTRGRLTHGNTIKYIKMAASSNFGNVFSILVASAWLPFQPMRPVQLLTQNLLYDISQIAIPFDRMDASYLAVPRGWAAGSIGWFMVCIGPVSSIFDITTFCLLWFVYGANTPERQALFQTGWFTVGILTQCLIVHMIRTERIPFIQEVAAWPVVLMSLLVSAVGLALPYTPVGRAERFTALPPSFYGWAAATVLGYAFTVQLAKVLYIRRFRGWL